MNIHEYQAKAILRKFGVAVPRGRVAYTTVEAEEVAQELGGPAWVVKAQIHAGGRGKGGGVKLCTTVQEVVDAAKAMIGMNLVTHQTGADGKEVTVLKIFAEHPTASQFYLEEVLVSTMDTAVSCNR